MTSSFLANEYIEFIGQSMPQIRNAQEYVEVLTPNVTPQAREATSYLEFLTPTPVPKAQGGVLYVDVLVPRPPDTLPFIGWGRPL